jgi:predicted DNA-binding protein YlxM (UPF0122 family)
MSEVRDLAKNLNLSVLLDFYGDTLTEKQKNVLELYYNEDLSLSEIAEHEKISRQGVRDSIKRGEEALLDLEEKLKMAEKFISLAKLLDDIKEKADAIYQESSKYNYSKVITKNAEEILKLIEEKSDLL